MNTLVLASRQHTVGSSVAATLIASYLADQGQRVLAIDLNPAGDFARAFRCRAGVAVTTFGQDVASCDWLPALPKQRLVLVDGTGALPGLTGQQAASETICDLQDFLTIADDRFDSCVIDTPRGPDGRQHAALASAHVVFTPVRLDHSALHTLRGLFSHPRCGLQRIRATLNRQLRCLSLLPIQVASTPDHRAQLAELAALSLLIALQAGEYAQLPRLGTLAKAIASGVMPWELEQPAAKRTWQAIEPSLTGIVRQMCPDGVRA